MVLTSLLLVLVRMPWVGMAAIVAGFALFSWFLWSTRFTVVLGSESLDLRMAPFPSRRIPLEEIQQAITHMSYPWGIGKRGWSVSKSPGVTVYFTGAGAGLVLELEDGKAVWFNTARPEELAAMLPRRRRRR